MHGAGITAIPYVIVQEKHIVQKDDLSCELIFLQAVEEVNQRKIDVGSYTQELQSLRLQGKQAEVSGHTTTCYY